MAGSRRPINQNFPPPNSPFVGPNLAMTPAWARVISDLWLRTGGGQDTIYEILNGTSTLTTSDVPEGTNLYYTTARARSAISVSGGALSYSALSGVISYSPGSAAAANTGTSGHTLPYLDGNNTWSGTQALGSSATATTSAFGTNTTALATTAFVQSAVNRGQATVATDVDFTLTAHTSAPIIRHTGVLTADRTVTLATVGAVAGDTFQVARTGAGAFNLILGGLKNLATNTWAIVAYDGSAWYLSAYGAL